MAVPDLRQLSPTDAAVTLLSLPRRYRTLLLPVDANDPVDEVALRLGPDGWSAATHLEHAVRDLGLFGHALQQVLVHDQPTLHPGLLDGAERAWPEPALSVADQLDELQDEACDLASRIDRADASAWSRTASVDGTSLSALDLLREAVRSGLVHLDGVEVSLRAARR